MERFRTTITPVLTIRQAAQAVVFYQRAFGAEEIYRSTYPDGRIVAELAIDGARFRVADEAPEASNLSPQALNGTTVRGSTCWSPTLISSASGRWRTVPSRSRRSQTSPMGCAKGGWLIPLATTG